MDYSKRIDKAYTQIAAVRTKVARKDLLKMLRAVEAAYTKLDAESVECRRLQRTTARYTDLVENCEELLAHLEKHITFASLLNQHWNRTIRLTQNLNPAKIAYKFWRTHFAG